MTKLWPCTVAALGRTVEERGARQSRQQVTVKVVPMAELPLEGDTTGGRFVEAFAWSYWDTHLNRSVQLTVAVTADNLLLFLVRSTPCSSHYSRYPSLQGSPSWEARVQLKTAIALLIWQIRARSFNTDKQKVVLNILAGLDNHVGLETLDLPFAGTGLVVTKGRLDLDRLVAAFWTTLTRSVELIKEPLREVIIVI